MALFGKSSPAADGNKAFSRSDRKADRFFEHAQTTADARNYDYSIECSINGLRHQPDNVNQLDKLREVSLRRKVGGGKKPGLMGVPSVGPSAVDKMLTALKVASFDPTNYKPYIEVMKLAIAADAEEEPANLAEVAYWAGCIALELNPASKKDLKAYTQIRDQFAEIAIYDKAVEACKRAIQLKPNDTNLLGELKNLEAQNYAANNTSSEEGGFRKNIKDSEEQSLKQAELSMAAGGDAVTKLIEARRAEHEEEPEDLDKLQKLVDALVKTEKDDEEREAITLLLKAHELSGAYKYKVRAGDLTMKQMGRTLRLLANKLRKEPGHEPTKLQYTQVRKQRLAFELKEYGERAQQYPTDLAIKFELGKRQFMAGEIDDAIGTFQQAKNEPKTRSHSHLFLGKAYMHKKWLDEAIDTLSKGVELHPQSDDSLAKELRYDLMLAYQTSATDNKKLEHAEEARQLSSSLLQIDVKYKDIQDRVSQIKALLEELRG